MNRRQWRQTVGWFVTFAVVVGSQPHVEPTRWWRSAAVAAALHITDQQSCELDRLYEGTLSAQCRASVEVADVLNRVSESLEAGSYDDDLLHLTAQLATAKRTQCELRHQVLALSVNALKSQQRHELMRLVAARRVIE